MLKLNSELRAQAREALQGNWLMAAVAALIYSAIVGALQLFLDWWIMFIACWTSGGIRIHDSNAWRDKRQKTLTLVFCSKDSKTTDELWEPLL